MQDFGDTVTTAAGWNNLLSLMQTAGFTGGGRQRFLKIIAPASDVYIKPGHTSATTAPAGGADGVKINNRDLDFFGGIDAGMCWIHTAGATDLGIISSSVL